MILYENELNPVVYMEKAYRNLVNAVLLTALAKDIFDKGDIEILWDYVIHTGDVTVITEENGARNLVKSSFKMFGDFIDSRLLSMLRDYKDNSISDFIFLYLEEKKIVREEDRVIKSGFNDLEFMDCASTTGMRRKNNEDFVCSICSPLNEKVKLLLVCDGMGGFNNGAEASKIVAEEIVNWFNSYDFSFGFYNLENEIKNVLDIARATIKKHYFMSGTTLTLAIVGESETFIGNVGDSRAYIIKDGILLQITEDDSEVWEKYYKGDDTYCTYQKDDLRFLPGNNIITNAVDDYVLPPVLHTYHVLNSSYDGILLTSDGVTDILSDETIIRIFNENLDKYILDKLLYEACLGNPDYPDKDYDEVLYPTLPGKDNASVAVYLKK